MKFSFALYRLTFAPRYLRKLFYTHFNRIYFKLAGVKVGQNLKAINKVYLDKGAHSYIEIGNDCVILSGDSLNPLSSNHRTSILVANNAKLRIGNNSGMSSVSIRVGESIAIGDDVKIGANTLLIDTDSHSLDWRIRMTSEDRANAKNAPIVIEDGVLIGTGCIILKGVTIGEHTVIGAGSVVCKNIPANCIAAGNPAKVIKYFE